MNTFEKITLVAKVVCYTGTALAIGDALNNVASRVYDSTNPEKDESNTRYIVTKCGILTASYMAAGTLAAKFFRIYD